MVTGLFAVLSGITGNLLLAPENAKVFTVYFLVTLFVVGIMFARVQILKIILYASSGVVESVTSLNSRVRRIVVKKINEINNHSVIFFTRGDDASNLNKAALYVMENEQTKLLTFVHVY
ncbi:MAG: hypothetical protein R3B45_05245 [Bdellovibrionota bacterium]